MPSSVNQRTNDQGRNRGGTLKGEAMTSPRRGSSVTSLKIHPASTPHLQAAEQPTRRRHDRCQVHLLARKPRVDGNRRGERIEISVDRCTTAGIRPCVRPGSLRSSCRNPGRPSRPSAIARQLPGWDRRGRTVFQQLLQAAFTPPGPMSSGSMPGLRRPLRLVA